MRHHASALLSSMILGLVLFSPRGAASAPPPPRGEQWSSWANHTSSTWLSVELAGGVAATTLPSGVVPQRLVFGVSLLGRGRLNLGHVVSIPLDIGLRQFSGAPAGGAWQTYSMSDVLFGTGLSISPLRTTALQLTTTARVGVNVLRTTATTPEAYNWGGPGTFVGAELELKVYPLPSFPSLELGARWGAELFFSPTPDASSPSWVEGWTQSTRMATSLTFGAAWHF